MARIARFSYIFVMENSQKHLQMQISPDFVIGSAIGLVTAFLWAAGVNVYKSQGSEATPLAINALKMWVSLAVMAVLVVMPFRTTAFIIPYQSVLFLAASVTVGLVIGDLAYLIAQDRIGVSYAYPIAATYPVATYLISIYVVNEEILVTRVLGILLAVVGVMLISQEHRNRQMDEGLKNLDRLGLTLALLEWRMSIQSMPTLYGWSLAPVSWYRFSSEQFTGECQNLVNEPQKSSSLEPFSEWDLGLSFTRMQSS
jgi:uncharacterized membrane protein